MSIVSSLAPFHPAVAALVGDCEYRPNGLLRQPVNAVSSLGYLVAGGLLARRVRHGDLPGPAMVLAAATALEGIGSAWYHGASGRGAQLVHDLPLMAVSGYLAGWHLGRVREVRSEASLAGTHQRGGRVSSRADQIAAWTAGLGLVSGGAAWMTRPGSVNVVVAAGAGAVVAGEVVARSRGLPPVWGGSLAVLGSASLVAWWAGRTESSLCRPGSLLQPHALWHVATAAVIVMWASRVSAIGRLPAATSAGSIPFETDSDVG